MGTYPIIIKGMYDRPTANIILSGEKLKAFPLKIRIRQGCHLLLLFNIVLGTLATVIRYEKEMQGIQIQKEAKLSLFVDNHLLSIENPNDTSKKQLLEIIQYNCRIQNYTETYHISIY